MMKSSAASLPHPGNLRSELETFHLSQRGIVLTEVFSFFSEVVSGGQPGSLEWFTPSGERGMLENVEGAFVCSDCTFFDGNTGCGQGVCNHSNKECNCVNGYSGGRCQAPP